MERVDCKNNIFTTLGPVVQLDRISDFGSDGWGFESLRGHPSGKLVIFNRFSVFCFSQFP